MSMRLRLNVLIVGLLGLTFISFVIATVSKARPRVIAENESIIRISKDFLETAFATLDGIDSPKTKIDFVLRELSGLRHVRIYREGQPVPPLPPRDKDEATFSAVPKWFADLVAASPPGMTLTTRIETPAFGKIVIEPDSSHEVAEIWDSLVSLAASGLALALGAMLFASWIIQQTLQPMRSVGSALIALGEGHYEVQVPSTGPPEVQDIAMKVNSLAQKLNKTREEKRRLAEKVISIEDQERRDLARELHDELGPYLFAVRAGAAKLKTGINQHAGQATPLLADCDTILERIDEVQQVNRRVLQRLRPAGLDELGLEPALRAFIGLCISNGQDLDITLEIDPDVGVLSKTTVLTVYRLVQEGVTNAMRHAGAKRIDIMVDVVGRSGAPNDDLSTADVRVIVHDDGSGLRADAMPGFGIVGMEERVLSLGGSITISGGRNGGTTLNANLPISYNS